MQRKRILAAVMSLCMVAGVASYGAPVISQTITAQAEATTEAECYSFDEETGALTLRGEVGGDALREFNSINCEKVNSVVAEEGTVLPENSNKLFHGYSNCTSIDLSNADTSNVTNMSFMFWECSALTKLDLSSFNTSKVTDMSWMFCDCLSLISLDVSGFDTSNVTDMKWMFMHCSDLTALDISGFDTSNVTDMSGMFCLCRNLSSLDVSGFDTSKVTYMGAMFNDCNNLTALDVSGFDTSNVTYMDHMFCGCSGLTSLDLSGFDTSKVTDMCGMFINCNNLIALDVSSFDTSNVTDMNGLFEFCENLTALDVSGFDTSNVTDMEWMFRNCSSLTSLDLSGFDTSNVTDMGEMFSNCNNLKYLTLGENFKNIPEEAGLHNTKGWVNENAPSTATSGRKKYAVIENNGKNTYIRYTPTFPTNIEVTYFKTSHQVRFTWDRVEGADRYGIAVYLAGKWKVQNQDITGTSYITPKNLTPGKTYKVAIAARVNGTWDTANAIKYSGTITVK
ncbi:MAG: BspA family leucine-rich repeat surface protein [Ruminococcus sp.]|uniref:BspA family leucine-rich repeat surface protein n=1 Tax=Ruminococcus sp. TaxID=41978 RepID=UPI0025E30DCC|nr:BspA family leucine-rich repeat surface protein [Ruminococcus sp.]MCR5541257.1 BspA family leucine-rich repeat surface protein [Ruminococcus sp.]